MKKLYFIFCSLFCLGIGTGEAQYTVLHIFNDTTGGYPYHGSLTLSGNTLYGMAWFGGAHDSGCIFSIHTNGSGYKDLWDFNGIDGCNPEGSLTLSGNVLYGMTSAYQGTIEGSIFSIDTNGNNFKDLLDFNGTNGAHPLGDLTLSGKMMYGMTANGGAHDSGCIFSIDTNGNEYKDLFDFTKTTGTIPLGSLAISGKVLYGMTSLAGANNDGCIFSIDTNGTRYKDLLDFNGISNPEGASSWGSLTFSGNMLYGMTYWGGANNDGVIFSVDTNGNKYRDLLDFNSATNGTNPQGNLTLSGNVLYGMSTSKGTHNGGYIFSIDTNGNG